MSEPSETRTGAGTVAWKGVEVVDVTGGKVVDVTRVEVVEVVDVTAAAVFTRRGPRRSTWSEVPTRALHMS